MDSGALGPLASRRNVLVALLLTALIATVGLVMVNVPSDGHKPVIKLDDCQWASLWVNNAIAEFIIEKGYGYPVEIVAMTIHEMMEALPKGEIDLTMEVWKSTKIDWYNEQIEKGSIVNLGMTYEAGPQFYMIPKWVAEQYNITTVFDMKGHWELFKDPQDPSKGVFRGGIIGWSAHEVNVVKLESYGLTKYYNIIPSGSSAAMEAALARAQVDHQPVFAFYWAPTALMGAYDWHILEEPPYTDEVWEKVTAAVADESLRPIDEACAYENYPIDKVANRGLLEKAPDVVEMLRKMVVGLEPLNTILAWAKENDVKDWEKAAIHYLQNYEDRWKTWVTPKAYERIKKALEEVSG